MPLLLEEDRLETVDRCPCLGDDIGEDVDINLSSSQIVFVLDELTKIKPASCRKSSKKW